MSGSRITSYVRSFDREFTELLRKRDGPKGTPDQQIEKLQSKVHALEVELQHERLKSRPTTPIGASNSDPAELAILLDLTKQAENEVLRELVKDLKAQLNAQNTRFHSATPRGATGGGESGAREAAGSDVFASAMRLYSFPAPKCRCSEKRRFAHHACLRFVARVFRQWQRRTECMQRAKRFMRLQERRQFRALSVSVFRHWQKSEIKTKQLRAIKTACGARCVAKLVVLWRLETAIVRKSACNTESHLQRLRASATSLWREYAAVRTAARRHRQRLLVRGLAWAVKCLAQQRLISQAFKDRTTSYKREIMEEWRRAFIQQKCTQRTLAAKWISYLVAQVTVWEARSKRAASGIFMDWVRWAKVSKRIALLRSRQSRQHQRQQLHAWATRVRQVAGARLQRKGTDVALTACICQSWQRQVKSSKRAARAVRRRAHLLLSTWRHYVWRAQAVKSLARGISLCTNTRILKWWSKYAIAWQPVRDFRKEHARMLSVRCRSCSVQRWRESCVNRQALRGWLSARKALRVMKKLRGHTSRWRELTSNRRAVAAFCQYKRRARFKATFSDMLSRWSEDAAWSKAVSVHAEFVGIERNSKADTPCFRSWVAHTRMRNERRAKVSTARCRCAVHRTGAAWGWWRSWASARIVARAAIRALAARVLQEAWNAWWNLAYATRRKREFFIAYRWRGNLRKSFEAFKWDKHRLACLQRANDEFDRRHLQTAMFEAWAAYVREMRLVTTPSVPARQPPLTERSPIGLSPAPFNMAPASSPPSKRPRSLNSTPRQGSSTESFGLTLSTASLSSAFSHALETARSNQVVSRVMHVGALGMGAGSHLAPVNQDQEENIALLASSGAESSRSHAESLRRASGAAVVLSAPGGASLGFMFGGPGWSS